MSDLTPLQQHCLVALLEIEADNKLKNIELGRPSAYPRSVWAAEVARKLGYRRGPRQRGNGAKDGRSFSGYGAVGKWVAGSLMGLAKRKLVSRYYADHGLRKDRMLHNELTDAGREEAYRLHRAGVKAKAVEVGVDRFGDTQHVPLDPQPRRAPGRRSA